MSQVKSKFLGTDAQMLMVYFPAAFFLLLHIGRWVRGWSGVTVVLLTWPLPTLPSSSLEPPELGSCPCPHLAVINSPWGPPGLSQSFHHDCYPLPGIRTSTSTILSVFWSLSSLTSSPKIDLKLTVKTVFPNKITLQVSSGGDTFHPMIMAFLNVYKNNINLC